MKRSVYNKILSFFLSVILLVSSTGLFAFQNVEKKTKDSEVWIKLNCQSGLPGEAPAEKQEAETGEDDTEELSKKLRSFCFLSATDPLLCLHYSENLILSLFSSHPANTRNTLYIEYRQLLI